MSAFRLPTSAFPSPHFEPASSRRDFLRSRRRRLRLARPLVAAERATAAHRIFRAADRARTESHRRIHQSVGAQAANVPCQSQIGYLVLYRRRSQPPRSVRPQARTSPSSPANRSPTVSRKPETAMGKTAYTPLLPSQRKFKQYGQSGIWVSDWYPEIATCVDDMAVIHSCWADGLTHVGSVCEMNTGSILMGRPCLGSWSLYGLGAVTDNLPGFVVLTDYSQRAPRRQPAMEHRLHARDIPRHQVPRRQNADPACAPSDGMPADRQRREIDFIQQLNRHHLQGRTDDNSLEARIASYELAYRMQTAAPEATDLSQETAETLALYGIDQPETAANGTQLPHGPSPGRTRRSLRAALHGLGQQVGRPQRCRRQSQPILQRNRPAHRRRCSKISNAAACSIARSWFGGASSAALR